MQLDISHDRFVRTTEARHEAVVRALLARVWDADVRKAAYRARYCVGCEEFKDDDDLDDDGNCLVHRTPCPEREEVPPPPPPLPLPHAWSLRLVLFRALILVPPGRGGRSCDPPTRHTTLGAHA